MVFFSKGEKEFLADDAYWGDDGQLKGMLIDLILTDKPYGMLHKLDGIVKDKEIPDRDIPDIAKRYSSFVFSLLSRPKGTCL
jgi:hypothetical protein